MNPGFARLTGLFPRIGPVTRAVLLYDFTDRIEVPPSERWAAECRTLTDHRLAGTALRLARERNVALPSHVTKELAESEFAWSVITAEAVRASLVGLHALNNEQIEFAVTKGPGIARFHKRTQERPYSDLDLVVRPESFQAAVAVLVGIGFGEEQRNRQPWPVFNRWCREAINLRASDGGSLDVHHRIPPWYWTAGFGTGRLLAEARDQTSLGVTLPCVSSRHNLLIAALHIFSDRDQPGHSLMAWRDLLTMASVCSPDDVAAEATEVGLGGWLRWILMDIPAEARPAALIQALDHGDATIPGRRRLQLLMSPQLRSRHALGHALRLPILQASLYLSGTAVPSPTFLRQKFPDERRRYLHWWGQSRRRSDRAQRQLDKRQEPSG